MHNLIGEYWWLKIDLSSLINNSHILGYVDDTKCYKHIATQSDQQLLQND